MGRIAPVIELSDKDRETFSTWTRSARPSNDWFCEHVLFCLLRAVVKTVTSRVNSAHAKRRSASGGAASTRLD